MSTPPQPHTDDSRPAAAQAELAKFVRDLHVAGLSARTIQAYSSYLGRLQAHGDHTTAAMLSEEQLREWLAMLVRERRYRAGSLKVVHAAIKKFYRPAGTYHHGALRAVPPGGPENVPPGDRLQRTALSGL